MANPYGMTRTNYFRVRDEDDWAKMIPILESNGLDVYKEKEKDKAEDAETTYCLCASDDGFLPTSLINPDGLSPDKCPGVIAKMVEAEDGKTAEGNMSVMEWSGKRGDDDFTWQEIDSDWFAWFIARYFLHSDDILVTVHASHEKQRYAVGSASAINAEGESVTIDTDDIYAMAAKKFGVPKGSISVAAY